MTSDPKRLPQREAGAQLPEQCAAFPRPWLIPGSDVPGWFCDQWPTEQEPVDGWPASDLDAAGGDERDEDVD